MFLPPRGQGPDHLDVEVRYADYVKEEVAEDTDKKPKTGWKRVPCGPYHVNVPLDRAVLEGKDGVRWPDSTSLRLRGELRETRIDGLPTGTRVLSLFLVNERQPLERDRDLNFIFQVELTLRYEAGFIKRPNRRGESGSDDDQRVLALMFRDRFEWAVGHNTSVERPKPDPEGRVRELRTTALPCYEVHPVKHRKLDDVETEMRRLAEFDGQGRGKTEAYLGLIAFTLLLRRLRGKSRPDEGRGVAVILRYTLRLLTLDQLGRAATLMCALEEMRRRDPKRLGNARFTVGLWVGKSATANQLKDVHKELHDFTPGRKDSPFPLSTCPWCGADIKIHNIKLVDAEGKPSKTRFVRAVVYCEGADCLFTERKRPGQGLPVLFVDEQIYKEVPDFLVATVDKFAMMPWRAEAGMLFGRATHLDDARVRGHARSAEGRESAARGVVSAGAHRAGRNAPHLGTTRDDGGALRDRDR